MLSPNALKQGVGSGDGSKGNESSASQDGQASPATGNKHERAERADREDLWWPPHAQQQSRDGRLNDH